MAYPNFVTKSQRCAKSCDFYEKQITCFALKTKCCRVIRMSSPNKHTSAVYRVKDSSCNGGMLLVKTLVAQPALRCFYCVGDMAQTIDSG